MPTEAEIKAEREFIKNNSPELWACTTKILDNEAIFAKKCRQAGYPPSEAKFRQYGDSRLYKMGEKNERTFKHTPFSDCVDAQYLTLTSLRGHGALFDGKYLVNTPDVYKKFEKEGHWYCTKSAAHREDACKKAVTGILIDVDSCVRKKVKH